MLSRPNPPRALRGLTAATAALALLAGCADDSTTRPAEPPEDGGATYESQISPAAVWRNIEAALEHADPAGWESQLSESFYYVPDPATASAFPDVAWQVWSREDDVDVIEEMSVVIDSVAADMRDVVFTADDPVGATAQWDLIYDIRLWSSPGGETRYRGRALIAFALEGAVWQVVGWEDLQRESHPDNPQVLLPTFGEVRGALGPWAL